MSSFDPRQRPPATRSGWHVRVCEPNGTERLEDRLDLRQWRSYEALWLLRCDARPALDELQRLYDAGDLLPRPDVGPPQEYDLLHDPERARAAMRAVGISGGRSASG